MENETPWLSITILLSTDVSDIYVGFHVQHSNVGDAFVTTPLNCHQGKTERTFFSFSTFCHFVILSFGPSVHSCSFYAFPCDGVATFIGTLTVSRRGGSGLNKCRQHICLVPSQHFHINFCLT